LNFGFNVGYDKVGFCEKCSSPITQYLGGFQSMGAYRIGQLRGDKLVHAYATYMYNISDGGVLKQPVYAGFVAEAGDAWFSFGTKTIKYSGTLFFAVDSKIGDIYLGYARGSNNNSNIFLQLGRRFNFI
jgi:NTE family protein